MLASAWPAATATASVPPALVLSTARAAAQCATGGAASVSAKVAALAEGVMQFMFTTKLKVVAFLGLVLALPIVLFQLWRFITPGLTQRERKYAIPFVVTSMFLFAMGGFFAFLTLPKGLAFLLGFAGTTHIELVLSTGKYLGFVMLLILAFGAAFEFPLILVSLTIVGVVSSRQLRDWRRYALVVIAIVAAVITPSQDWFTMTALMVPLIIFYELSILVARLLKK